VLPLASSKYSTDFPSTGLEDGFLERKMKKKKLSQRFVFDHNMSKKRNESYHVGLWTPLEGDFVGVPGTPSTDAGCLASTPAGATVLVTWS